MIENQKAQDSITKTGIALSFCAALCVMMPFFAAAQDQQPPAQDPLQSQEALQAVAAPAETAPAPADQAVSSAAATTPAPAQAQTNNVTQMGVPASDEAAQSVDQQAQSQQQTQQNAQPAQDPLVPTSAPALPALSTLLQQQGAVDEAAAAAPPGLDLPITGAMPDGSIVSTEQTEEEKKAELRAKAFEAAKESLMPLRPNEIRDVLELNDQQQQAIKTPIYPNPKPESTFQTISLDPGQPPVEIKTAVGHVTTISMLDVTGQPWPIQDLSWAGNFEVLQPENGGNLLRITPLDQYAYGNVSMRMVGINAPVIMTLRTERKSVQLRADIQIPEVGPNGTPPPIQTQAITTTAGSADLTRVLEGVVPSGAEKLKIDGVDGRTTAYVLGGITYVRTPYTLLSPAWNASARSADGTNVYAMNFSPVLLLSDKGQMLRAQISQITREDIVRQ
jgi:intracellular multiplication protein IcmK